MEKLRGSGESGEEERERNGKEKSGGEGAIYRARSCNGRALGPLNCK